MTSNLSSELLLEAQRRMVRIRLFDERASKMVKRGQIPGTVHTSIGQEAQVVGGGECPGDRRPPDLRSGRIRRAMVDCKRKGNPFQGATEGKAGGGLVPAGGGGGWNRPART